MKGKLTFVFSESKTPKKRLSRNCPFCQKSDTHLSRHLSTCHKDRPEVCEILHSKASKLEKRRAFAKLRNLGIVQRNSARVKTGESFEKVKTGVTNTDTVHCSQCNGSYSQAFFHRHRTQCVNNALALKAELLSDDNGFVHILNRFQSNDIGNLCRRDEAIKRFGQHLWLKDSAKVDKTDEVRKSVMSDMRCLAHLYLLFRINLPADETSHDARDLLKQKYWEELKEAVLQMTTRTDRSVKYGLKNALYYLLVRFGDFVIGELLSKENAKDETQSVRDFLDLLKHHQNAMFGDAKYLINKARQENLRLPARMPSEDDLKQLRNYTISRIAQLRRTPDMTRTEFVELRNLLCSRLTLFNARRGGEPSRLMVDHWTTRHQWIPSDLSTEEKRMFKKMTIMFGTGKGNHLVSTIGM